MKTETTSLVSMIGDLRALQRLIRSNVIPVMLQVTLQGKDVDAVSCEVPLPVMMGMENLLDDLLTWMAANHPINEKEIEAYTAERTVQAKREYDEEQAAKAMETSSEEEKDDCDCPACTLRRELAASESSDENGPKINVIEAKGQIAQKLMEVLLGGGLISSKADEELIPPKTTLH